MSGLTAPYVCSALYGQKREPDPLEQAVLMFGSHHVGFGNPPLVLCENSKCS